MLRALLTVVLPLALPTLLFFIYYVLVERRRALAAATGQAAPWWVTAPWPWLIGSGVVLAALILFGTALIGGHPPDAGYDRAPRAVDWPAPIKGR